MGLILAKASTMRISIPLDLSSRPFIPPPCFTRSRRPTTLLTPSLVFLPCVLSKRCMKGSFLRGLSTSLTLHSFSVTLFALGSRLFFNPVANKHTQTPTAPIPYPFWLSLQHYGLFSISTAHLWCQDHTLTQRWVEYACPQACGHENVGASAVAGFGARLTIKLFLGY